MIITVLGKRRACQAGRAVRGGTEQGGGSCVRSAACSLRTDATERAENDADGEQKGCSPAQLFSETLKSLTAKQSMSKGQRGAC